MLAKISKHACKTLADAPCRLNNYVHMSMYAVFFSMQVAIALDDLEDDILENKIAEIIKKLTKNTR